MFANKGACCGMGDPMMMHHDGYAAGVMGDPAMMHHDGYVGGECGCHMDPIIEPGVEKCVQREFCHEVRHICPVHTKVINNHIYRHVYDPCYTCSEENVICNIDQGSCCNFR